MQPFEFTAGQPVSGPSTRNVESAGGLYAGGGGIKPPPALSQAVIGMRAGGKRSVLVPAELGYGSRGEQEIPPNCDQFELQVRVGVVGLSELLPACWGRNVPWRGCKPSLDLPACDDATLASMHSLQMLQIELLSVA